MQGGQVRIDRGAHHAGQAQRLELAGSDVRLDEGNAADAALDAPAQHVGEQQGRGLVVHEGGARADQ